MCWPSQNRRSWSLGAGFSRPEKLVEMEITGSRESFCNSLLLWIRLTFRGGFRDHKVS
jgi:hypothetical protein